MKLSLALFCILLPMLIWGQLFIGNNDNALRTVEINVLKPAVNPLPASMAYMVLISPDSSSAFRINVILDGVPTADYQYYIGNMVKHSTTVAYELWRESPGFERVMNYIAGSRFRTGAPPAEIFAGLCASFQANGAAMIDEYKVSLDIYDRSSGNAFDAEESFVAYMNITCYVGYTLYNATTGTLSKGHFEYKYRLHSGSAASTRGAYILLPEILDVLDETAAKTGYQFANRLAPVWTKESRKFYATGNKPLREAAEYIQQGKWDEAFALWEQQALEKNPITAEYARFNLILRDELSGDFDDALMRANRYKRNNPGATIERYIAELEKRKADKIVLDKQLGVQQ